MTWFRKHVLITEICIITSIRKIPNYYFVDFSNILFYEYNY